VRIVGEGEGEAHLLARREGFATEWPKAEENLVFRAFDRARGGAESRAGFVFEAGSEVPLERGFGSSGAAVAAGLLLGAAMSREAPRLAELLRIGVSLEGHPDNVTASLYGGCTLCHPSAGRDGAPVLVRNEVHPSIGLAVAWPAAALSTHQARGVLPDAVPFADAIENPRRLALLLEGLRRGDPELIALGGEDRLHTRHRLPLISGGAEAIAEGKAAGAWLVAISGAGSGLVALGPRDRAGAFAGAMEDALRTGSGEGTARVVEPVLGTPRVERG